MTPGERRSPRESPLPLANVLVVDASVVLKWFIPEAKSEEARSLLTGALELLAPDLLFPEVGNAIWKKVWRGELTSVEAQQLASDIAGIAVETVPSRSLLVDAESIALAAGITVHDATYVALALKLRTTLVTADERLGGQLAARRLLAEHVQVL